MAQTYLQWQDYIVLAVMLMLSAAVGFYYACTGGKQKTTKEYLLADQNMHWFPVGCSLLASYVSSQTLIGLPGEVYTFGTIILYSYVATFIAIITGMLVYLPVLSSLKSVSVFEYIELRFGKPLKYMMEILEVLFACLFMTLMIYGPALSISAVTGVSVWLAVLSVALVAMLYTIMGGMKAVLWTDTVQLIVMVLGVMLVLIMGTAKLGGITAVWEVNKRSGRLDMFEKDKALTVDPRMRHTVWGVFFSFMIQYTRVFGCSQTPLLRVQTLRSKRDTTFAYLIAATGTSSFGVICGVLGLVLFAHYNLCDPLSYGTIYSKDQLYPLYVMELLEHLPGLSGLILSSVVSASLSSISSGMSSMASLVLQDFIRPCRPNLSDRNAAIITKITALLLGVISITLVLFARYFGSGLLSMGLAFAGMFSGPSFAVFTMGMFFPTINHRSAFIGFVSGIAIGVWMGFGALINKPFVYEYPTTTVGCNITGLNIQHNLSSPLYDPSTWNPHSHYRSGVNAVYDISYLWLSPIAVFVSIMVALIASLFTSNKHEKLVKKKLLSPLLQKDCCFVPKSWRKRIDYDDTEEKMSDKIVDGDSLSEEATVELDTRL